MQLTVALLPAGKTALTLQLGPIPGRPVEGLETGGAAQPLTSGEGTSRLAWGLAQAAMLPCTWQLAVLLAALLAPVPAQALSSSAATTAAALLPENQQILARDNAPPAPNGANPGAVEDSKVCQPGDASCYDHTGNLGNGTLKVSRSFPSTAKGPYNYAEALHKSYIFYDAQRSGRLPFQAGAVLSRSSSNRLHVVVCQLPPGLPVPCCLGSSLSSWASGDSGTLLQRLAWRGDSCLDCVGPAGEDLSGGFYEAGGSYLKFSFPTAYTFTQLAWGVIEFKAGYVKARAGVFACHTPMLHCRFSSPAVLPECVLPVPSLLQRSEVGVWLSHLGVPGRQAS